METVAPGLTHSGKDINRVVVIGSSGSGKTTLGRFLSSKWRIPFCDLGDLACLPNWTERERGEERADVERFVAQKKMGGRW